LVFDSSSDVHAEDERTGGSVIKMAKGLKKVVIYSSAAILYCLIEIYRKCRPIPPRIYFCYNQSIHHIYHSIFIAIELSNLQKRYEVVVLSTSREASKIIAEELSSIPNNVTFIKIRHLGYNRIDYNINWFVFLCRIRMHRPAAIILTDYFDNVFRQLLLKTFWVYVSHGAKSRTYGYDSHIKDYDLVIVPGERVQEQIQKRIGMLDNCVMVGYSKIDYFCYHQGKPLQLFKDLKPVILYNPHFEKEISSFFDNGIDLLKSLSKTDKYNIIFMPHPDLARKYSRLLNSAVGLPNVVIVALPQINLDYMAISNLYITDVSSAVFEWLYFNKPALFFNTKRIDWQNNRYYFYWTCGQVVEDVSEMLEAIDYALKHPEDFHAQRKAMFDKTFSNQGKNVSKKIAETIWYKLNDIRDKPK